MPVNPDATVIPDEAEVWIALKSDFPSGVTTKIPTTPDADLAALGWGFIGLIDDKKGIPIDPSGEVKEYDAFGRPAFRKKFRKGKLNTGFTVLEWNDTTRKIILPGSTNDKIGIPKNTQIYVLYRWVDEDVPTGSLVWVSLMPGLAELKGNSGVVDGELVSNEIVVHHVPDSNGDVFKIVGGATGPTVKTVTIGAGVTALTVTVDGQTTSSITALTAAGIQTAVRALSGVGAAGVTVTGSGPFTMTFATSGRVVTAAGTGGTVTVA